MSTYRISELAGLSHARNALDGRTPAGPCDDGCGCTSSGGPDPAGAPEIVCTLQAADMAERVSEWTSVLDQVTERREVDGGVSLTFPSSPELAGRLADLAVREQRCCAFLTFAVLIAGLERVTLEVRAPQQGRHLLPRLFAVA